MQEVLSNAEVELSSVEVLHLQQQERYCWEVGTDGEFRVVNPMATTSEGSARVTFTLFCPVLFATSNKVWWAMVDSGAQVSLISSGLVAYLGLLDEESAQAYPS